MLFPSVIALLVAGCWPALSEVEGLSVQPRLGATPRATSNQQPGIESPMETALEAR
jgi:hypothetical protein